MTDIRLHPDNGDKVTRELRVMYAAPTGEAYWTGLESRIMNRITEMDLGWWVELDRWVRPALAAAAVLMLAASVAMFRAHEAETEVAYENILTPIEVPVETAVRPMLQGERDATLRFVLGR